MEQGEEGSAGSFRLKEFPRRQLTKPKLGSALVLADENGDRLKEIEDGFEAAGTGLEQRV